MSLPRGMFPAVVDDAYATPDAFGAEPGGPYDRALREGVRELLLYDASSWKVVDVIPVWRFTESADRHEQALVQRGAGPLIDLGCGPGRMVQASMTRGRPALGIDLSHAACQLASAKGIPVLRRSLFEQLPGEGRWETALLLDGNIGIGGDPVTLLRRVHSLLAPGGTAIVEGHTDASADACFTAVLADRQGRSSAAFPWARVGAYALHGHAQRAGLRLTREWSADGRTFCEYARSST